MRPVVPILYAFLLGLLAAGCNRSNDANVAQAKAEAEAARADAAKEKARADSAAVELATVTAELAKLKAAGQETAKTAVDDQDRKAAAWVVRVGGVVRVTTDGVASEHPKDGKLPDGPLKVTFVNLTEPSHKNKLTNEGVKYLTGLKHLKTLILDSCQGVDDFSFLKGVENLETFHCKLTDAALSHLKNLTRIKDLAIGGFFGNPDITDVGLAHLEHLKNLERLDLSGISLTDTGLLHLAKLNKLQWLNLFRTRVSDADLRHLKGLTELRELHLAQTQVMGPGIEHLKALPKLVFLNINENKITDEVVTHLKGLSHLQSLHLNSTQVTDDGIKSLKAALPNCNITANVKR